MRNGRTESAGSIVWLIKSTSFSFTPLNKKAEISWLLLLLKWISKFESTKIKLCAIHIETKMCSNTPWSSLQDQYIYWPQMV